MGTSPSLANFSSHSLNRPIAGRAPASRCSRDFRRESSPSFSSIAASCRVASSSAALCFCHSLLGSWLSRISFLALWSSVSAWFTAGFRPRGLKRSSACFPDYCGPSAGRKFPPPPRTTRGRYPLPANDVLAAGDQPRVVDAEHCLELGLVATAQEAVEDRLVERLLLIGREQRILVPLAANDFQLLAVAAGQHGPDPQAAVVVEEVVRGVAGDAVEQVPQRSQGRALAGLVGTIDEMKTLAAGRQVERDIGERSEGTQIESQNLHFRPLPAKPSARRASDGPGPAIRRSCRVCPDRWPPDPRSTPGEVSCAARPDHRPTVAVRPRDRRAIPRSSGRARPGDRRRAGPRRDSPAGWWPCGPSRPTRGRRSDPGPWSGCR